MTNIKCDPSTMTNVKCDLPIKTNVKCDISTATDVKCALSTTTDVTSIIICPSYNDQSHVNYGVRGGMLAHNTLTVHIW